MPKLYTLTLTETELEVVHDDLVRQLGRMLDPRPVRSKPKPEPVEPFSPNTGDPALDAFMLAHHDPKWRAPQPPKRPVFPFGLPKKLTTTHREEVRRFNLTAIAAWKSKGYEVVIDRLPGDDVPTPALDGRNVHVIAPSAAA